ncbi:MAG: alcohol dehydrogenase catalytic domain-containing protein [Proteobacteria bacterium]|nr:alcohol dehydrogenase catalytic domain-containing protein [Pseudomonadota bacterium]
MKAAVVYGENDIRITDVPTPSPGPGQILVKVKGSGVCATDVKILGGAGLPKELPTILGHEVAGTIEVLGEGVTHLEIGRRVAVYPIAACGECFYCRRRRFSLCLEPYGLAHGADGGFAEYVLIPEQIIRLDGILDIGDMPFDLAAMIEPTSCCIAAAEQCRTKSGDTVLVIGCGPLGLLHTIVSKAKGATVMVVDVNQERLEMAEEVGADTVLNPNKVDVREAVRKRTGVGAEIVIAAIGSTEVVEESLPLVRNGGVFNIFGGTPQGKTITLDPRWLHYGEIVLTGTFAASLDHFISAFEFVKENSDRVAKVISERCELDGVLKAVENVKKGSALKSIILFD